MNSPVRRRSTATLAVAAFLAALAPLAAATGYCYYREHQLAAEVAALERRLGELDATLQPIGDLARLRSEMLVRKQIVDVLQRPQQSLHAALAVAAQAPPGDRVSALELDEERLSLRVAEADAAAATERLGRAGFIDVSAQPASDGVATITARIDPARLAAAAAETSR